MKDITENVGSYLSTKKVDVLDELPGIYYYFRFPWMPERYKTLIVVFRTVNFSKFEDEEQEERIKRAIIFPEAVEKYNEKREELNNERT